MENIKRLKHGMEETKYDPYMLDSYYYEKYKTMQQHFKSRLKEKYNLEITDDEYDQLILKPLNESYYKINGHRAYGFIKIKGIEVKVIRIGDGMHEKDGVKKGRPRGFITCLTDNDPIPVPDSLIEKNITPEQFKNAFNEFDKVSKKAAEDYVACIKHCIDNKEPLAYGEKRFMVSLDNKYNPAVKHAAKLYAREGKYTLSIPAKYFINNPKEILK